MITIAELTERKTGFGIGKPTQPLTSLGCLTFDPCSVLAEEAGIQRPGEQYESL